MILNFDTFSIRSWQPSDAASLALNANNIKIADQLLDGFPHPYSEENAKDFISFCLNNHPSTHLTIAVEGKAVGAIGFKDVNVNGPKTAELGFWIGEQYWNQGIMTKAVAGMLDYGFNLLGLVEINAQVFLENVGSKRVLEKNNFELLALKEKEIEKKGKKIDIWYFRKKKGS